LNRPLNDKQCLKPEETREDGPQTTFRMASRRFGRPDGNLALGSVASAAAPLVFTEDGPVVGVQTSADRQFLGIPYAAAPVGDLRWRPPVRHPRWFVPLHATQFANHCPQPATPFGIASLTEDCLFLNVFTPQSRRRRRGRPPRRRPGTPPSRHGLDPRRRLDARRKQRL
jgi:hypothetical protein